MMPSQVLMSAHSLRLTWDDGEQSLSAESLRKACRCAECQAAALQQIRIEVAAGIALNHISMVGNYAVQLHFNDQHERGIYPWVYLRSLATLAA